MSKAELKRTSNNDWWNDLSEESKRKTLESIEQEKKGETLSHSDVMKRMSKQFPQLRFK